jgi:hypothetical protein
MPEKPLKLLMATTHYMSLPNLSMNRFVPKPLWGVEFLSL